VFWLKGNVKDPNEKGTLGKVHEELYEKLREVNLATFKVTEDCYRNPLSDKSWFSNPKKVP